jgi:hypothetical protein
MIIDDEDIAYGRQQQRKLDEKDFMVISPKSTVFEELSKPVDAGDVKLIEGELGTLRPVPQFAKDYGVQQYANHDPAPHLSFSNSWEPPRHTRAEKWIVRTLWVVTVAAMVAAEVLS